MQFYKYFSQYSGFTFSHILFEYHINKGYSTKSAKKKVLRFYMYLLENKLDNLPFIWTSPSINDIIMIKRFPYFVFILTHSTYIGTYYNDYYFISNNVRFNVH